MKILDIIIVREFKNGVVAKSIQEGQEGEGDSLIQALHALADAMAQNETDGLDSCQRCGSNCGGKLWCPGCKMGHGCTECSDFEIGDRCLHCGADYVQSAD